MCGARSRSLISTLSSNEGRSTRTRSRRCRHYTLLIVLFLWRFAGPGRGLLALYPVAMAFALVYMAEHYVVDILLGWIYAVTAFWAVNRLAERIEQQRARAEPAVAAERAT